jgi:hypothetical protein
MDSEGFLRKNEKTKPIFEEDQADYIARYKKTRRAEFSPSPPVANEKQSRVEKGKSNSPKSITACQKGVPDTHIDVPCRSIQLKRSACNPHQCDRARKFTNEVNYRAQKEPFDDRKAVIPLKNVCKDDHSLSSSSGRSDYSDNSSNSNDTRQSRRKSYRKKSGSRRRKSSSAIYAKLMKTAHHRGLQTLLFYDSKTRRRAEFIRFITNIKAIVRSVSELRDFITDFPLVKRIKYESASTAFFRFLESKVDDAFQQHLNNLYRNSGVEDGVAALELLTKICAAQSHEQQQDNLQSIMSVKVRDGENIPKYCVRFNKLCNTVAISGVYLTEAQLVDYFLMSVIDITDPRLLLQIESWRRLRDTERETCEGVSSLSLDYVQTQLSQLYERFIDRVHDGQREVKPFRGAKTTTAQ